MAGKNNIVTFEEARRTSKRRRRPAVSGTTPSKNLTVALDAPGALEGATRNLSSAKTTHVPKPAKGAAFQRKRPATASQSTAKKGAILPFQRSRSSQAAESGDAPARTRSSSRMQAREASKRRRTKERASKKFTKMYGDASGPASAGAQEAGPRAAVYQAKMGGKHRKAARALAAAKDGISGGLSAASGFIGGIALPKLPAFSKLPRRLLTGAFCVVFTVFMLYTPAQQYYCQARDRDRAAAEYAAVLDRNQALSDSVDTLQSDEGIEDKAHAEYGMVKDGEQAGSVAGLDVQTSTDFVANVVPGGVPAPNSWYSGFLDLLFGYTNAG